MKGYSEQRGVQSQIAFDAKTRQFVQIDMVHDFVAAEQFHHADVPTDAIIDLAECESKAQAKPATRKDHDRVMRPEKLQRVG